MNETPSKMSGGSIALAIAVPSSLILFASIMGYVAWDSRGHRAIDRAPIAVYETSANVAVCTEPVDYPQLGLCLIDNNSDGLFDEFTVPGQEPLPYYNIFSPPSDHICSRVQDKLDKTYLTWRRSRVGQ